MTITARLSTRPEATTLGETDLFAVCVGGVWHKITAPNLEAAVGGGGGGGGDMTAAEILAALLTVDGPGSGLNADLLDGQSSAAFEVAGAAASAVGVHAAATDPHGDRAYTDAQIATVISSAFDFKVSVKAASTANLTLSGTQTIDGVSVGAGERVLAKNQSTGSQNGIYVCAAGAWSRSTDADVSAEVTAGMAVPVEQGTVNGGRLFMLTTAGTITLGSTSLTFTRIDAGDLAAANNLSDLASASTARTNLGLGTAAVGAGGGVSVATYSAGWPARPLADLVIWVSADRAATTPGAATGSDIVILPTPYTILEYAISDEATAITTGTAKLTVRAPYAFTLAAVRMSLSTASSSGIPTIDINENGTTVLSTKLTIDATEKTSTTAAAAAVISDSAIADDAEITFDVDVAGTGAKGCKVRLYVVPA